MSKNADKQINIKHQIVVADVRSNSYGGISTGHFVPVARMYCQLFSDSVETIVAGGPVYKQYFPADTLLQLPYNVSGISLINKLKTFRNCRKLFSEARGKTIIIQQSTDVTAHLGIALFYHGDSRLYVIRYSTAGLSSWLKRCIYRFCKYKINGIICPTEEVGHAYGRPYCVVPDYIYTYKEYNNVKPYAERYYDFCILGRIVREKGVIEAIRRLAGTKYRIIVAGKPEDDTLKRELIKARGTQENVTLILSYLSEEDYNRYLHNSRYAILNYSGEYSSRSSGVVFDMLFNDIPVIGQRCKSLQFIEETQTGYLYDDINTVDFEQFSEVSRYNKFIENINAYRNLNNVYRERLINFLSAQGV